MPTTQIKFSPYKAWLGLIVLVLLALALPVSIARLIALSSDPLGDKLAQGTVLIDNERPAFLQSRKLILNWFPSSAYLNDLALDAFLRSEKKASESQELLAQAELWQRQALRLSPADPYGWFRLSYILYKRDKALSLRSALAWTKSMETGRYEPAIMFQRLQVGMAHEALLSPEARAYFPVLIRGASFFDADELARQALSGSYTALVEKVLSTDEGALAYFRKRLFIETQK